MNLRLAILRQINSIYLDTGVKPVLIITEPIHRRLTEVKMMSNDLFHIAKLQMIHGSPVINTPDIWTAMEHIEAGLEHGVQMLLIHDERME